MKIVYCRLQNLGLITNLQHYLIKFFLLVSRKKLIFINCYLSKFFVKKLLYLMNQELIKVLLIEDNEDDYLLINDLLSELGKAKIFLDWENT